VKAIHKYSFFVFLFIHSFFTYSQSSRIDSLELALKQALSDTARVNRYSELCWEYKVAGEKEKALEYGKKGLELAEKTAYQVGMVQCMQNIGSVYMTSSDNAAALEYYKKAGKYWESLLKSSDAKLALRAKDGIASVYGNMGLVYQNLSDFPESINYQLKALKIQESLNNYFGVASTLSNIGNIYSGMRESKKALEYQRRALSIAESKGFKSIVLAAQINIGSIYFDLKDYPLALEYQLKSLAMAKKMESKFDMVCVYGNIGDIYANAPDSVCYQMHVNPSEKLVKAMEYQRKNYDLCKEIDDKEGMVFALGSISAVYLKQADYRSSIHYAENGLELTRKIGDSFNEKDILYTLYKAHKGTGNLAKALGYYEQFVTIRDTLFKEEKQKDIMKKQMDYEFEKKENAVKVEQEKERALAAADAQIQRNIIGFVVGGMLLFVVFSIFMVNRWRITRKQKEIIERQKTWVDEKNRQMTDSIHYAKRIQESILINEKEVEKILHFESFVFHQPKDIVSGDFYWLSHNRDSENGKRVIAAADCTGHGVPGAFLSMIGNMLLNQIVNEKKITHPSEILKELHQGIYDTLHYETDPAYSHDGMDISLCTLDVERQVICYAGANTPLYFICNEKGEGESGPSFQLNVIKADNQSLGDNIHRTDAGNEVFFSTHEIPMQKGMRIYLFSDGYMDQYNAKGKNRIGSMQFKKLLLESAHLTMQEQKKYLMHAFHDFMQTAKQVDDVLVIGIKI
jgi:tetratricopeptide (TPR) repeat protein/serine phosphatase RsbU (regulator of sigma subunit)